jgi:cytidylate kinase
MSARESKKTVVVVSGPPASGSTSVAKEIAKRLGFRFFIPGKLQKKLGESKLESKAAIEAWKTKEGISEKFHKNLDEMQTDIAKEGNVVLCGKLSIHFVKDLSNCKVWLDVPLDVRAKRAAERDNMPVNEAKRQIKERENIERREWKKIYGWDYFYQKDIADLVLDSSEMTLKETVDEILEFIESKK